MGGGGVGACYVMWLQLADGAGLGAESLSAARMFLFLASSSRLIIVGTEDLPGGQGDGDLFSYRPCAGSCIVSRARRLLRIMWGEFSAIRTVFRSPTHALFTFGATHGACRSRSENKHQWKAMYTGWTSVAKPFRCKNRYKNKNRNIKNRGGFPFSPKHLDKCQDIRETNPRRA